MQVLLDDNSLQEEQEQASTTYLHVIGMHPFGVSHAQLCFFFCFFFTIVFCSVLLFRI